MTEGKSYLIYCAICMVITIIAKEVFKQPTLLSFGIGVLVMIALIVLIDGKRK